MGSEAELGSFLRAIRESRSPASVGLTDSGRRRTPGLRREEVAMLSGVSVSWYTWLEQGRPIRASLDVLNALARTLSLTDAERAHLIELAGHRLGLSPSPRGVDVPGWARRLIDSLDPIPAYLLGPTWEYLAWNAAQAELFSPITELADDERNLLWVMFAVLEVRTLIADWHDEARRMIAQFRADVAPWRDEPGVVDLVARLRTVSAEFDEWWQNPDVAAFETRLRRFHHPTQGTLVFEYQQLVAAGRSDLRVVMQVPVDESAVSDDSPDGLAGR